MAQLTVYIDESTLRKIGLAAKKEGQSVSLWVKQRLTESLDTRWPAGYFELFGSLKDSDLKRPDQGDLMNDRPREKL